jgi:hypothetical protein
MHSYFDAITKEEFELELTAKETKLIEQSKAKILAEKEAKEARQTLRSSAYAKLAALGLTPEEIAAITA